MKKRKVPTAFQLWLYAQGHTVLSAAPLLGCSHSTLARLTQGRHAPSLELAFRIEDVTGGAVTARSWLTVKTEGQGG